MHQQTKMQIKGILIMIILLVLPKALASQDSRDTVRIYKKTQIGIQLNPYINEHLLSPGGFRNMATVSAIRYGRRVTKNFTTGFDFSCFFNINTARGNYANYFRYTIGIYTRYLYPAYSRFQLFAEVSPYYLHFWSEITATGIPAPYRDSRYGYYVAPGVTLYTKNKKVSFDLYYKFIDNGNSEISYKVNLNF